MNSKSCREGGSAVTTRGLRESGDGVMNPEDLS
jgi:hypothetical protein